MHSEVSIRVAHLLHGLLPSHLARAFLQLRQALRVTDSGTLRRLDEEELLPAGVSLSPRGRRGSDPVLSDVDWLWLLLLADALLSPNEGRILRKFEEDMFKVRN